MIEFRPIGVIRTPYKSLEEMPIQPAGAQGVVGQIELEPCLADGLRDLDGFSHIIVLYHFHRAGDVHLSVTPFLDSHSRGLFATRAPSRPNPIGLSILKLTGHEGSRLIVENVDILDETPLLDIKPYVPAFDQPQGQIRCGWLDACGDQVSKVRSDTRFQD